MEKPNANGRWPFLPALFLLFFSSGLFCIILTSQPYAGGRLDILVEEPPGAILPTHALLFSPDGSGQQIELRNGQASVLVEQPGRWQVQAGDEQAAVEVLPSPLSPRAISFVDFSWPWPVALLVAALLLLLPSIGGAALWALAFPHLHHQAPRLLRQVQGGQIQVILQAGSEPLMQASLEEKNHPHPLRLGARRLEAGEALRLQAPHVAAAGPAVARFMMAGQWHSLECQEGQAVLLLAGENEKQIQAVSSGSTALAPAARKLQRL